MATGSNERIPSAAKNTTCGKWERKYWLNSTLFSVAQHKNSVFILIVSMHADNYLFDLLSLWPKSSKHQTGTGHCPQDSWRPVWWQETQNRGCDKCYLNRAYCFDIESCGLLCWVGVRSSRCVTGRHSVTRTVATRTAKPSSSSGARRAVNTSIAAGNTEISVTASDLVWTNGKVLLFQKKKGFFWKVMIYRCFGVL